MNGYVGDGETMPTTPSEALGLLSGYVDDDERKDIDAAFSILTSFIAEAHLDDGEVVPNGHVMGHNLCVYCLQYDMDVSKECPDR